MEDSRSKVSFGPFWPKVVIRHFSAPGTINQLPVTSVSQRGDVCSGTHKQREM